MTGPVEKYLVACAKSCGFEAEKFVSPGKVGVPDRIIWLGGGQAVLVEVKEEGDRMRPEQKRDHLRRRMRRDHVYVVTSKYDVDVMIEAINNRRLWFGNP